MSVPSTLSALLRLRSLAALLVMASCVAYAKGPEPALRLPLQPMGFQPTGAGQLASAGSQTTVHFVDDQHLLVTFAVRRLMKREPDDPADDQDRTIEAVLVNLASGKLLAHTSWRMHDTSQYLWDLGHGRFLLRKRDTLTTFMPLENLANSDPFVEQPFLVSKERKLAAIMLSPDRDLLTVETVERPAPAADNGQTPMSTPEVHRAQLNFYRIVQPARPMERVVVQAAGLAMAAGLVNLSLTSAGYVEVLRESPTRWLFDFDFYAGKYVELSPFDTSCRPHPFFVSASEFVAFGCRGGDDRLMIGGFNMRGEQMWQQNFTDTHAGPNFAFAPGAGRFALSRNIVSQGAGITVDFAPAAFTTQEIRVYQTYNGRQLLRVEASPVQRFGQNYDLSPDGLRLAVIRDGAVELHRLPALTGGDEAEVRTAKSLRPEDVSASVSLVAHARPGDRKTAAVSVAPAPGFVPPPALGASRPAGNAAAGGNTPAEGASQAPGSAQASGDGAQASGDEQPSAEVPRKPPTLYTLPTDQPKKPQ